MEHVTILPDSCWAGIVLRERGRRSGLPVWPSNARRMRRRHLLLLVDGQAAVTLMIALPPEAMLPRHLAFRTWQRLMEFTRRVQLPGNASSPDAASREPKQLPAR